MQPAVAVAPAALRRALSAEEVDACIAAIAGWRSTEQEIMKQRRSMVANLRKRQASWDSIGWLFGQTAEAVRLRYGRDR